MIRRYYIRGMRMRDHCVRYMSKAVAESESKPDPNRTHEACSRYTFAS